MTSDVHHDDATGERLLSGRRLPGLWRIEVVALSPEALWRVLSSMPAGLAA